MSVIESPAARFELLELHGNCERTHRALAVLIEEAVEVTEAEREIWIDRVARTNRREVRLRDAAPHPVDLIQRERMSVVAHGVDPHQSRRMTELAQCGTREQHTAVALRLPVSQHAARRHGAAFRIIRKRVEKP